MRALWSDSALVFGSRSTGLAKWFKNPGPGFMYLNGECFVICGFYKYTLLASTEFNLTVPARRSKAAQLSR